MSDARTRTAGGVAIEITRQLAEPVRALRDRLGLVVDHLERHVATSTGPAPYPWRSLQALRQDLAGSYLEATTLARRLDELDRALDDAPPAWFELAPAVDLGLRLAAHHLHGLEVLIDLGQTPAVRGTPGMLALLVAQLVGACAQSARALDGSALSVRVFLDDRSACGFDANAIAVVAVSDNGAGSDAAEATAQLAREILEPWGASIDVTSQAGQGSSFELHLTTVPA